MRKCKNCKYWVKGKELTGVCDHWCTMDAVDIGSMAFTLEYDTLDDSGLSLYLVTGRDFHCAHFKGK